MGTRLSNTRAAAAAVVALAALVLVPLRIAELLPAQPSLSLTVASHLAASAVGAGVAIVVMLVCGARDRRVA